jgi:hypothetical protein
MPAPAELAEVGMEVDAVIEAGLETGPVGIVLGTEPRLRLTVGPPMRQSGTTGFLGAADAAATGHR